MPERTEFIFGDLELMAMEAMDGIDYKTLKRVLRILRPDVKVRAVKGNMSLFIVETEPQS